MRPKPGRSYSAENGLELRRICRIAERGGMRPPLKPSTNTWPPFGPADEPARACSASASSSGSSGSASSCAPSITIGARGLVGREPERRARLGDRHRSRAPRAMLTRGVDGRLAARGHLEIGARRGLEAVARDGDDVAARPQPLDRATPRSRPSWPLRVPAGPVTSTRASGTAAPEGSVTSAPQHAAAAVAGRRSGLGARRLAGLHPAAATVGSSARDGCGRRRRARVRRRRTRGRRQCRHQDVSSSDQPSTSENASAPPPPMPGPRPPRPLLPAPLGKEASSRPRA